ncbi:MAG: hypothetical protein Q9191_003110 [Dirinaria sp. TL-2023a]
MDDALSVKSVSTGLTAASAGTKRRRAAEPKFYAVRAGFSPGVYHTWDDCKTQIKGFKGATFKSFSSLIDAERFLAGEDNPGNGVAGSTKFYAVKSGRMPGIYTDWTSVQQQIKGWTKPRHKLFQTRAEAQRFLDEDEPRTAAGSEGLETDPTAAIDEILGEDAAELTAKPPTAKRTKKAVNGTSKVAKPVAVQYNEADYAPGTAPLPPGVEDGFDPTILLDPRTGALVYKPEEQRHATKKLRTGLSQTEPVRIHTDGSSLGNGKTGAFAGIGVYFGPSDPRNVSDPLPGTRQTNQRAELTAIQRALDIAPLNRAVVIVTDSKYSIDCVTSWYINWRKNGWKTAAGKTVENKDLVESILAKIEQRDQLMVTTGFEWIKGHANHPGNIQADRLAIEGAKKAGRA